MDFEKVKRELKAAEEWRKKLTFESKHKMWLKWYEGDFGEDVVPVNLTFTFVRSLIPQIYFRDPRVSVKPARPGTELYALVLEELDNKLLRKLKVKRAMKRAIMDAFFKGTGVLKIGYSTKWCPPDLEREVAGTEESEEKYEYSFLIQEGYPWVVHIPTEHFLVPEGVVDVNEAPWVADIFYRDVEEVRNDKRYKRVRKEVQPTAELSQSRKQVVKLMQFHDLVNKTVYIIEPSQDLVLFEGEDLLSIAGPPYVTIVFNERADALWGVPDMAILQYRQDEMNDARTQESKHRKAAVLKLLVQKGAIDSNEIENLMSPEVKSIVECDDITGVKDLQVHIPADLWRESEVIRADAREELGFSRVELGEFEQKTARTATEVAAVARAHQIRYDERRDILADALVEVVEKINHIIFALWQEERVEKITGPFGIPVWVRFTGRQLAGEYLVEVEPDTGVPETKEVKLWKAMEAYKALRQEPLVRADALVEALLRELFGTRFVEFLAPIPTTPPTINLGEVRTLEDLRAALRR